MLNNYYIFTKSLQNTAKEIINSFKSYQIVILCGDAGSGKTSLCKFMVSQKMFCTVAGRVRYALGYPTGFLSDNDSSGNNEISNTNDSELLILDFSYGLPKELNVSDIIFNNIHVQSQQDKVLVLLRTQDITINFDFDYKLVSMPLLQNTEMFSIATSFSKKLGIKLSKEELKQVSNLSQGSVLKLSIILNVFCDNSFEKTFEFIRNVQGAKIDARTWATLALLVGSRAEEAGYLSYAKELYLFVYQSLCQNDIGEIRDIKSSLLIALANIFANESRYAEALNYYDFALSEEKNIKKIATIYTRMSEIYEKLGQFSYAEMLLKKTLSLISNTSSHDHSTIRLHILNLINLGAIYRKTKRLTEALDIYSKCLSLAKNNTSALLLIYNNLATIYALQENYQQALFYYNKAIQIIPQAEEIPNEYLTKSDFLELKKSVTEGFEYISEKANN